MLLFTIHALSPSGVEVCLQCEAVDAAAVRRRYSKGFARRRLTILSVIRAV